jgi:4-oxalomesaconate tautomerase
MSEAVGAGPERRDPEEDGIPCLWMRGGSSKGAYFRASDLPDDVASRDDLLRRIMGSPDPRQIDGIGGADPLTSKVAVLAPPSRDDADVDYLFLQVSVDRVCVSDAQGCGNILAGVGPAAIEQGLVPVAGEETLVRIHMTNTGKIATTLIQTLNGRVRYAGQATIDGVPGAHAPVPLMFQNIAGSTCGALLPTGNAIDVIDGMAVTMIDNGMPVVVLRACDFGLTGLETPEGLDNDTALIARIEAIRLKAGPMMKLGDVSGKPVPKMTLASPPRGGGTISTRTFIPHRCHKTIGVFAAVSVATACTIRGTTVGDLAELPTDGRYQVEHPTGAIDVLIKQDATGAVNGAGVLRTARKLFEGRVFPTSS